MKDEKLIPVEVVVTQKHLDEGYQSNPGKLGTFQYDPVALALVDAGIHGARVELSTFYRATFPDAVYKLPPTAQTIVLAYLHGKKIRVPRKFTVKVPESWVRSPKFALPKPDGYRDEVLAALAYLEGLIKKEEPQEKWYLDRRSGIATRRTSMFGTVPGRRSIGLGRRKYDHELAETLPI